MANEKFQDGSSFVSESMGDGDWENLILDSSGRVVLRAGSVTGFETNDQRFRAILAGLRGGQPLSSLVSVVELSRLYWDERLDEAEWLLEQAGKARILASQVRDAGTPSSAATSQELLAKAEEWITRAERIVILVLETHQEDCPLESLGVPCNCRVRQAAEDIPSAAEKLRVPLGSVCDRPWAID